MTERPKEKSIDWIGTALDDIRAFPLEIKEAFGHDLWLVQVGEYPESAKPLKGKELSGVYELRRSFDGNTYRTVYIAKLAGRIYVLHCFQKKSKSGIKTPDKEIEIIKARLKIAIEDSKGEKR
jgi:phage-related protein